MSVQQYVGMTLSEAKAAAQQAGFEVAVEVVNGPQILECEYRAGRVNFRVENGKVVSAHVG